MWNEIKRKFFHLCGLIYVVGLITLPRRPYIMILTGALIAELIIEIARLKIPRINLWFQNHFKNMFRPGEEGKPTGVFWMLAGVNVVVVLVESVPLATTCLLYLLLGDGIASLVGMRFGGPHWPKSKKRVSGSAACLLVCVLIGVVILRAQFGWFTVLVGALVATILEFGIIPLDDNFTIPVGSAVVLLLLAS